VPQKEDTNNAKKDSGQALSMILDLLGVSPKDFSVDVPLVSYGLDSLAATRIAEALKPYADVSQMQLLGGLTWSKIRERIDAAEVDAGADSKQSLIASMQNMATKYSVDFATHVPSAPAPSDAGDVVLITGTTGTLGASVLNELVLCPTVRSIYALNRRSTDGRSLYERQKQALEDKGLESVIGDSAKIVLLEGDLTAPDFNLKPSTLQEVCVPLQNGFEHP
jgi:aryl carrier-like protein